MTSKKLKPFVETKLEKLSDLSRLAKPWNLLAKNLVQSVGSLQLIRSFYKIPGQNNVIDLIGLKEQELLFIWYCPQIQWYSFTKLLPLFLQIEKRQKEIFSNFEEIQSRNKNLKPTFLLMTTGIDVDLFACFKYFQGLPLEILEFQQEKNTIQTLRHFALQNPNQSSKRKKFPEITLTEEERADFLSLDWNEDQPELEEEAFEGEQ